MGHFPPPTGKDMGFHLPSQIWILKRSIWLGISSEFYRNAQFCFFSVLGHDMLLLVNA